MGYNGPAPGPPHHRSINMGMIPPRFTLPRPQIGRHAKDKPPGDADGWPPCRSPDAERAVRMALALSAAADIMLGIFIVFLGCLLAGYLLN